MSNPTPQSILEKFSNIVLGDYNNAGTVVENLMSLNTFNPASINLMDMPIEQGTFKISPTNSSVPVFASGTYSVTNCIINDDDEIIQQTYKWTATTEATSGLQIISVEVSDDTACDYYYTPSDYYTPVNELPNSSVTSYSVVVNYQILLSAIKFFNVLYSTQPTALSALYYVKISDYETDNEVCVLNQQYVKSLSLNPGLSLSTLENIPLEDRSDSVSNQITYLQWVLSAANTLLYSQSSGSILSLPSGGLIETTEIEGETYGLYLSRANTTTTLYDENGNTELLFVILRITDNAYDPVLIP